MENPAKAHLSRPPEGISESRRMISLYIAFFGSLVLGVFPSVFTAVLSLVFLLVTLLSLYLTRRNAEEDSLSETHARFLIRTFWNANIIALLSVILSVLYFLMFVRLGALNPCVNAFLSGWEYVVRSSSPKILTEFMAPCAAPFMDANETALHIASFIAFGPVLLYLAVRFTRGWLRVIRKKNI